MEQVNLALEPLRVFLIQIGEFLPKLALAVVVLIAGWLIAKVVRFAVVRSLKAVNLNILTDRAGIDDFLKHGGLKADTSGLLAQILYWLVVLAALMVAFNTLGLAYVTDLIGRVVLFIPKVFVAVLILAFGAYFARFLATSVSTYCKNVGIQDADILSRITLYAVIVFVVVIALDQVNIGGDIIRLSFLILLSGLVLALSIAFGLGGQKWAASTLDRLVSGRKSKS
ncbi:MAG TPA: hypothetical protein DIC36_01740 [Gammaproteobacteria bacterium]|nr:hypothetical protein [Gammaproteobacteria bacterium]